MRNVKERIVAEPLDINKAKRKQNLITVVTLQNLTQWRKQMAVENFLMRNYLDFTVRQMPLCL
jgi:protein-arginine kinase